MYRQDSFDVADRELATLISLIEKFPNVDAAVAEVARLSAVLTLPKGTIHIISDVHGEDKKLRHVINNASGTLRPLIEKVLARTTPPEELADFLTLSFYPAEVVQRLKLSKTDPAELSAFVSKTVRRQFTLIRSLIGQYSLRRANRLIPAAYRELIAEMLHEQTTDRGEKFIDAIVAELMRRGQALHIVHVLGRLIRNLAVHELIIAGDCWDRGPRGDRVVEYLRQQPNVSFVWGNHDLLWFAAAMGHEASICTALRISIRYRRLAQIDDGYGIPLLAIEHLAREAYKDDPATKFLPKTKGLRPDILVARMQKAVAVMQFKLEGQAIERNPHWGQDHRRLLHKIDKEAGTIEIDGKTYALRDKHFPTIDPNNPYELSADERACLDVTRNSFLNSQKLQEHVRYMISNGVMSMVRDEHLIFHGCIPCDANGEFLPFKVDGRDVAGKALLDAVEQVILRADHDRTIADLDLMWYLWCGPRSPLFGKDRIATLERDFVPDEATHKENKDPYFKLIHEKWFCEKVLKEWGVDPERGLIVNGHVPVKVEKGEDPVKRSGKAITIDGAFSEAYGDHGYTLVLDAEGTRLARHHHFESVEAAIRDGVDILPAVSVIRKWDRPRTVGDTERGRAIQLQIDQLERLINAYQHNRVRQRQSH